VAADVVTAADRCRRVVGGGDGGGGGRSGQLGGHRG